MTKSEIKAKIEALKKQLNINVCAVSELENEIESLQDTYDNMQAYQIAL